MTKKLISLVIPCYNEQAVVGLCHGRLSSVIGGVAGYDFEVIYVNDGSRDDTLAALQKIRGGDSRVRIISLSRNFGKEAALSAGLDHARGNAVIPMDVDMQDPPEVLPEKVTVTHWQRAFSMREV